MACALGAAFPVHAQWVVQESHTTASLRGIDYVGGGVAWASGSGGTVLRTVDMGKTWTPCAVPEGAEALDFRGVQAFDAQTAIVMSSGKGDLSRLYKTVDGCRSWKLVFTNPDKDGFWDAFSFLSIGGAPNHDLSVAYASGVLLGDPTVGQFNIFETHDGGSSWSRRVAHKRDRNHRCRIDGFPAEPNEAVFAASNESLAKVHPYLFFFVTGGAQARIAYVDHFDLDFAFCHEAAKSIDLPLARGAAAKGAFAAATKFHISEGKPLEIMIVGGDYEHPEAVEGTSVYLTNHRKNDWFPTQSSVPTQGLHGYRSAVAYDASDAAWIAVGPNGTDVSFDDGRNWRALRPSGNEAAGADRDWNALSLPFAVGAKGRIGILREGVLAGAKENTKGTKTTKGSQLE